MFDEHRHRAWTDKQQLPLAMGREVTLPERFSSYCSGERYLLPASNIP